MAKFTVKVLLNETPDHRFGQYEAGDLLVFADDLTVEADELEAVPEAAFEIGNKMAPDALGHDYNRDQRSVSVGDVIVVTDWDSVVSMWACEIAGWKRL